MADYQHGVPILIEDTFFDGGIEADPTTVTYTIQGPDGVDTIYTFPGDPEITNPGIGQYVLSLAPPSLPGLYLYDVDATGAVTASRSATFTVLPNASTQADIGWAVVGPCTPWTSSQDIWDCCGQPMTTIGEGSSAEECPVDMTAYAMEASQILYELSGRLFAGNCERTVRPCGENWCGFQVLSRGHIVWDDAYWGLGWGWGGARWRYPSFTGCGCMPLDRVLLSGYPVREVTEVKIDGAVVDPTTYRLDERRYLTRVRASASDEINLWPACQMLDLPDTEVGTFSVTYRAGQDPPLVGQHAAAQLGCELYRACSGGICILPAGTTRVARQGITVDKTATLAWFYGKGGVNGWQTGLGVVDAFLSAYASTGIRRRPILWSPESPKYARPVGG